MVLHTCNPSSQKGEAGELIIQDQPELHSKILPQKTKQEMSQTLYAHMNKRKINNRK
jgi:hypothetical protein